MLKLRTVSNLVSSFVSLARLRIVGMIAISCALGYVLACRHDLDASRLIFSLIGVSLVTAGACSLNCYIERDADALMIRTRKRPLPSGAISAPVALAYGWTLSIAGCAILYFAVNSLSAFLGAAVLVTYLAIYTPAKRLTWLNTSIGAVPGAIPCLIGWAAARNQIDLGGWVLFGMLFLWQHTHFFPIAWLCKEDYKRAGFIMLPVLDRTADRTFCLTLLTAAALLPLSYVLVVCGVSGPFYAFSACLFGALLIVGGFRLYLTPSRSAARSVLLLSLVYLPALLGAVVADHYAIKLNPDLRARVETAVPWT